MTARDWSGRGWSLSISDTSLTATHPSDRITILASEARELEVRRQRFQRLLFDGSRPLLKLVGIRKAEAVELKRAVARFALAPQITEAVAWYERTTSLLRRARAEQRWLPVEDLNAMQGDRPSQGLLSRVRTVGMEDALTGTQRAALALLDADLDGIVATTNDAVLAAELSSRRDFFDTIEKSPLSDEQARAVVCFDNRVQLLAAAGAGKTSVMVGRAAYAVVRGFVAPNRILLLAFNRAAAHELQDRIGARFAAAGIDPTGVRASTFHSLGLEVIGRATGVKPRLASWLDQGDGVAMVGRIVDELRDRDPRFRHQWDLYRFVLGRAAVDIEEHAPDGWDAASKESRYRTLGGDLVRSAGERDIANYLFLNGVSYQYERPYVHLVGDAEHSQYRPDFYYPEIDVWHEHWALGRDGKPPASFVGYAEDMAWKRREHAKHGTALIETTHADVVWGDGLDRLGNELTRRGLKMDWNPDRPPRDAWVAPMKHEELHRLIRTFMSHVKSNSWDRRVLEGRLAGNLQHLSGRKTQVFLDIYFAVADEWARRLASEDAVDFEDMLVQAAGHIEAGRVDLGYELVLVDEFQDASRARARLVQALLSQPHRYLLAVGDDWQSINRFAGADLTVMTDFATWFGKGPQLALTTTFRCTQTICDTARHFVSRNPLQLPKPMRSSHQERGIPVDIVCSADAAAALVRCLRRLSQAVAEGAIRRGVSGTVSVLVLGRYRHDAGLMPRVPPTNIEVTFRTVHASKGLEADYVVIPGMTTGTYGFPSAIADDPVLHLAMPAPETYEHAEERRLFYVALTRARRAVTLITDPGSMSPFVAELIRSGRVTVDGRPALSQYGQSSARAGTSDGRSPKVEVCPSCNKGSLVRRSGPYGSFLGCSTFPRCSYKRQLKPKRSSAGDARRASGGSSRPKGSPPGGPNRPSG